MTRTRLLAMLCWAHPRIRPKLLKSLQGNNGAGRNGRQEL
jgi:hypothetical protein